MLSGSGALTSVGAHFIHKTLADQNLGVVQAALDADWENVNQATQLHEKLKNILDSLDLTMPKDEIWARLNDLRYGLRGLGGACRVIEGTLDVAAQLAPLMKGGAAAAKAGAAGVAVGGEALWRGLTIPLKGFAIAGTALNAVLLPFDIYQLVNASIEVNERNRTGKSRSPVAAVIGDFIEQLETQRDALQELLNTELQP